MSGVTLVPGVSRPEGASQNGVPLSMIANRYASISPSQNTGIETPKFAVIIVSTSTTELCRVAEMIPNVTPTMVANSIAQTVNSTVIGRRSSTIPRTGWLVRSEVPRSPRERLPR